MNVKIEGDIVNEYHDFNIEDLKSIIHNRCYKCEDDYDGWLPDELFYCSSCWIKISQSIIFKLIKPGEYDVYIKGDPRNNPFNKYVWSISHNNIIKHVPRGWGGGGTIYPKGIEYSNYVFESFEKNPFKIAEIRKLEKTWSITWHSDLAIEKHELILGEMGYRKAKIEL